MTTSQDIRHHLRRQRQRLERIAKLWIEVASEGVGFAHLDNQAEHFYQVSGTGVEQLTEILGTECMAQLGGTVHAADCITTY